MQVKYRHIDEMESQLQETKKYSLVRVRIELTTLALSAPRSTDWANGPCTWEISKGQTIDNPGIDPGTFLVVHQPARKRMWKSETETTQLESLLDRSFPRCQRRRFK